MGRGAIGSLRSKTPDQPSSAANIRIASRSEQNKAGASATTVPGQEGKKQLTANIYKQLTGRGVDVDAKVLTTSVKDPVAKSDIWRAGPDKSQPDNLPKNDGIWPPQGQPSNGKQIYRLE